MPRVWSHISLTCILAAGFWFPGRAVAGDADNLIRHGYRMVAGWSFGNTGRAVNPDSDVNTQKDDSDLLFGLTGTVGAAGTLNADIRLILTNFGRLVKPILQAGGASEELTAENSETSVRRAVIADLTLRVPVLEFADSSALFQLTVLNTGFMFDAQENKNQEVQDAASYLFAGPTLMSALGGESALMADLLFGTSEVLTGKEAFDFKAHHHLRIRPRLQFTIKDAVFKDKVFDIGLWADLGVAKREADAFTLFVAVPITDQRSK